MKTPKKPTTTVKIEAGSKKLTPQDQKALADLTEKTARKALKDAVKITSPKSKR